MQVRGCSCPNCIIEAGVAQVKIREGTPRHDSSSLCYSCKKSQITKGETLDEEIIMCDALSAPHDRIRFKVTACNKYLNAAHPSIREMEEIAFVLVLDQKKNKIGFVRHKDLARDEQWKLTDPDY